MAFRKSMNNRNVLLQIKNKITKYQMKYTEIIVVSMERVKEGTVRWMRYSLILLTIESAHAWGRHQIMKSCDNRKCRTTQQIFEFHSTLLTLLNIESLKAMKFSDSSDYWSQRSSFCVIIDRYYLVFSSRYKSTENYWKLFF